MIVVKDCSNVIGRDRDCTYASFGPVVDYSDASSRNINRSRVGIGVEEKITNGVKEVVHWNSLVIFGDPDSNILCVSGVNNVEAGRHIDGEGGVARGGGCKQGNINCELLSERSWGWGVRIVEVAVCESPCVAWCPLSFTFGPQAPP